VEGNASLRPTGDTLTGVGIGATPPPSGRPGSPRELESASEGKALLMAGRSQGDRRPRLTFTLVGLHLPLRSLGRLGLPNLGRTVCG